MPKMENLGNFALIKRETICFSLNKWAVLSFHPNSKELDLKSSPCGSMNHSNQTRRAPWTLTLLDVVLPTGGRHPRLKTNKASHSLPNKMQLFSCTLCCAQSSPWPPCYSHSVPPPLYAPLLLNNLKHPTCVMLFLPFGLCPVYVYM